VANACNPSYSGGRDQEEHQWNPSPGKLVFETLSQKEKKTFTERAGGVAQGVQY
jgi:hypothetical protein